MRTIRATFVAILATLLVAGCGIGIPLAGSQNEEPPCAAEFDIHSSPEPLGSNERFIATTTAAAQTPGLHTTLGDVVRDAGWRDDWDHMLDVSDDMSNEAINTAAGTSGICYHPQNKSWPSGGSSEVATGAYVFLRDGKPVQSASWYAEEGVFSMDDTFLPRPQSKTLKLRSQPGASPVLTSLEDIPTG